MLKRSLLSLLFFSHLAVAAPLDVNHLTPHYLSLPNGKIEYYSFGQGSPLVLISGYATGVSSWNTVFLQTLAAKHTLILFDNRDIGGSLNVSKEYSASDLAEDTYQLITQLHLSHPSILGISMGGMIAQQLAVSHEKALNKLVLINTAIAGNKAIPPSATTQDVILHPPEQTIPRYIAVLRLLAPPRWWLTLAYRLTTQHFKPNDDHPLQVLPALLIKQQQLVSAYANDNVTGKKIAALRLPVLILSGAADQVIPPENSNVLATTIPHAKLLRFPEGGHAMIYQFPIQLADAINTFLAEN